jgi:hypothetical protein
MFGVLVRTCEPRSRSSSSSECQCPLAELLEHLVVDDFGLIGSIGVVVKFVSILE